MAFEVHNLAEFNREVTKFGKTLAPQQFVLFHKKIALLALTGIVMKTPVKTGRARGNWQTTINTPATGDLETVDKSGGSVVNEGLASLTSLRPYQIVYITNNLPYIQALEEGSSMQAPVGMVVVTLEELKTMFL